MQQCPARRADFLERSRASLSRRERPRQPQFLPSHTLDTPLYGSSYTRVPGLVTSPLYLSVRHSKLPCTEQWCPGTLSPSLAFLSNAKTQRKGERCIERVRSFRARNRQEDPQRVCAQTQRWDLCTSSEWDGKHGHQPPAHVSFQLPPERLPPASRAHGVELWISLFGLNSKVQSQSQPSPAP